MRDPTAASKVNFTATEPSNVRGWLLSRRKVKRRAFLRAARTAGQGLVAAAGLVWLAGCGAETGSTTTVLARIDPAYSLLTAGDSGLRLRAVDSGGSLIEATSLTWASSDTSVAKVDGNGYLSGMGYGIAIITAMQAFSGRSASTDVTVNVRPHPGSSSRQGAI